MNTTVRPDESATPVQNSLRIIPIYANLMPAEVVETRRGRRARRLTLSLLAFLLVLVSGGYALAMVETSLAENDLTEVQQQVQALKRQQKQFDEVVRAQQETKRLKDQLAILMADDLRWSAVLSSLRTAAPAGVQLSSMAAVVTPKDVAAPPAESTKLPSTSKAKPIGTLSLTGIGPTKTAIAAYVDALAEVEGVADPYLGSVTTDDKVLSFTLKLTLTDELLGDGRFAPEDTAKKGGN